MDKALWGSLAGVAILAIFPLFIHLDTIPLFIFDEARLANNALEMAQTGNWLVTHFEGQPDMWNTKPPLMIWLQALCIKMLGPELLAVRLPSALAGLATILALLALVRRYTRSHLSGIAAALMLAATPGYIAVHSTRTGDYDALLTLWSTLFLLYFFLFLHGGEEAGRKRRLWLAMAFFTLGVLTKGIVIFLFLPGLLIYLILSKKLAALLGARHFWLSLAASILVIAAYYLARELAGPGYLKAVMENELGGRFLNVVEFHEGPWHFYFTKLFTAQFLPWIGLIPFATGMAFLDPEKSRRPLWAYALINGLGFLAILSAAKTKLDWYAVPVMPLLCVAAGGALGVVLSEYLHVPPHAGWIKALLIAGIFCMPYLGMIDRSYEHKDRSYGWEQRQYGPFMNEMADWPGYTVALTDYNAHILFYANACRSKGQDIRLKYPHELVRGDTVLMCEERARRAVLGRWGVEELTRENNCGLYRLKEK